MKNLLFLSLLGFAYSLCSLEDNSDLCTECAKKESCRNTFNLPIDYCSETELRSFNTSMNIIESNCDLSSFEGSVNCETTNFFLQGLLKECGPFCSGNEYVRINKNENMLYCACLGNCLTDFSDTTLNNLIRAIIVILSIHIIYNIIVLIRFWGDSSSETNKVLGGFTGKKF